MEDLYTIPSKIYETNSQNQSLLEISEHLYASYRPDAWIFWAKQAVGNSEDRKVILNQLSEI